MRGKLCRMCVNFLLIFLCCGSLSVIHNLFSWCTIYVKKLRICSNSYVILLRCDRVHISAVYYLFEYINVPFSCGLYILGVLQNQPQPSFVVLFYRARCDTKRNILFVKFTLLNEIFECISLQKHVPFLS